MTGLNIAAEHTSSYINCSVRADFPTPPDPTMMTLCRAGAGGFFLALDIVEFFVVAAVAGAAGGATREARRAMNRRARDTGCCMALTRPLQASLREEERGGARGRGSAG